MDLRQAAYVVAVVDEGSFTAAAASIPVSQPALSQAIATLERELGTELFHRLGRRVQLTAAGEAFVVPARRMLRDAEVARAAVTSVAGLTTGRLDIVALPTLVAEPLVELVGRFRRAHPGILVRIAEPEGADAVAEQVRSGACELGLGDVDVADTTLATDHLGDQELLAVLPPGTPLNADRLLPIGRLAGFPLITSPRGTSTRRLLAAALQRADPDLEPKLGVVTEHREAIVPLVMAGAGAAVLPEPIARAAAALGAVVASLAVPISRPVILVRRAGPLSPAAAAFRQLALGRATG
ncbi:LysR family transcriptional regulator [Aquihabitans sp. G128]|uniref:LysR family transcriptional regulator n=1 Tax=Aquihabitans sp. G128 TaxID=2849779 RepID=UPI001C231BC0|nr:LysR substrate-binding domain-containing protein [Aquihabitans sp. G128]QXC62510.1 LysR family transcriptional regulator [Aquihabitans sp. G128]